MKKKKRISMFLMLGMLITSMALPATVQAAAQKSVKITTIKSGTNVYAGASKSLGIKTNTKSYLSYKTSDAKIAKVKSGRLYLYRPGTVKIDVTAKPKSLYYKTTSKSLYIKVLPAKPGTPAARSNGKYITASVKAARGADSYQYQYASNSRMSGARTKTTKARSYRFSANTNRTYYIRARSCTKVNGKTYYSGWSGVKKIAAGKPVHTHKYTSKITKKATCTDKGVMTFTCTVCGQTKTKAVDRTQHNFERLSCGVYFNSDGSIHDGYVYTWPSEEGPSSGEDICSIWQCKYDGYYLACGNGIYDILFGDYGTSQALPAPHHSYCDGTHWNAGVSAVYETYQCTVCAHMRRGNFVGYRYSTEYVDTGIKNIVLGENRSIYLTRDQILEIREELGFSDDKMPLPINMK